MDEHTAEDAHPPVTHSVRVAVDQERAFSAFAQRIGDWWPLDSFAIQDDAVSAVIEATPGGRVYEVGRSGEQADWGTVTASDAPRRLSIEWRLPPGGPPTALDVSFLPEGADATVVQISHSGWSVYGAAADEVRREYEVGWPLVLQRLADVA